MTSGSGDAIAVITGCGVIAANGNGLAAFGDALAAGQSGLGEITSFDAGDTGRERAAEIHDFDEAEYLRTPKNFLDRNSALAFAACELAVRDSSLVLPDDGVVNGICVGSMGGNMDTLATFTSGLREKGPRLASPFLFPHTYANTSAGLLSIEYGLTGPHDQFCSGGAAGLEAIAFASECVRRERAPHMVAGGVEAFSEWLFRMAMGRGWLSPTEGAQECGLPFGKHRNGVILGEGAAFFVMESAHEADKRGAQIRAYVQGCGMGSSPASAMRGALRNAGVNPGTVGAVLSAAGGHMGSDQAEALAILDVFGEAQPAVVALKGMIGETLGASGALNLAAGLVALERGILPAVLGADQCAFKRLHIVCETREETVRTVLVNAGGSDAGAWVSVVLASV